MFQMEPIPEEDHELTSFSPAHTVKHEKKSRLTEVYTSEQVDTLVRYVLFQQSVGFSKRLMK